MCTNNMYVGCLLYVNLCLCLCLCLCVNPARVSSFFVCVCLSGNEFNHITSDQIRSNQIRFTAIVCVTEERYRILFNYLSLFFPSSSSFFPPSPACGEEEQIATENRQVSKAQPFRSSYLLPSNPQSIILHPHVHVLCGGAALWSEFATIPHDLIRFDTGDIRSTTAALDILTRVGILSVAFVHSFTHSV